MPDLNLASQAACDEIREIKAFWLGKGTDGFCLYAVTSYFTGKLEANTEFLHFVTEASSSIDPDCNFVGEACTDRYTIAGLYGSGIDSLFENPEEEDVLFVMKLRTEAIKKDLTGLDSSSELKLSAVLNTNEEKITFDSGVLTLPRYSIAVFTK